MFKNNFTYAPKNINNFAQFADEVVIAVNTSEDDTLEGLKTIAAKYDNVKVISTDISYDSIELDGKIKDAALQATTGDIKIQMDLDEYIPLSQKPKWESRAKSLLDLPYDGYMIATIDLWGDKDKIRADKNVGQKFRMHKAGLKRGIWHVARRGDKIDTSMSDTCELLKADGELAQCISIHDQNHFMPILVSQLNNSIFTIHEGYLDFEKKAELGRNFWKERWEMYSGEEENVPTRAEQLVNIPTIAHNLILE